MTKKKIRETTEEEKIPVGLNSRDFLKYYETHKSAFNAETGKKSKSRSKLSEAKSADASDKGGNFTGNADDFRPDRSAPSDTDAATVSSASKRKGKNVGSEPGGRGKTVGLRIIGGKFKSAHLEYSGDHRVRPMKDRIRESVFNLIGPQVKGCHAVDLFAGTGALAFESLSRGAVSATLIEVHFPTARVTRRNIAVLEEKEKGISDRIHLTTTDVFFWGKGIAASNRPESTESPATDAMAKTENGSESATSSSKRGGLTVSTPTRTTGEFITSADERYSQLPTEIPWLVFCSPPYDFYVKRQAEMLELIETLRHAAPPESIFVIEADDRFDFDLLGVEIPPKKRRTYLPAEIGIFMT